MSLMEWIANLLFPPKCPFCGRVLDEIGVCASCDGTLPWTKGEECLRTGTDGLRCAAPLWYEDSVRKCLLRMKFEGVSGIAEPLGELLARCAAEQFSGEFDTVTWVPVSRKRLKQRGYDQAELLARAACRRCWDSRPLCLLKKTVDNPAQSGITDAAARRANVLGVYEAAALEQIQGKRILLVDDICTTGETLTECVRVLKEAGAADVMCAAVAFARRGRNAKTL